MQSNSTNPATDLFGNLPAKRCRVCNRYLPLDNFNLTLNANGRRYRNSYCKECCTKVRSKWSKTPRGKECLAAFKAKDKARRATDEGRKDFRIKRVKQEYGLTHDQYQALLAEQGFVCAICHKPEHYTSCRKDGKVRNLCVDHAHDETRRVRGLLCAACNKALGLFLDDPALLNNAISYLQQST